MEEYQLRLQARQVKRQKLVDQRPYQQNPQNPQVAAN